MSGSVDNRGRSRGGEDGAAPASIPMSEVGPTVDDMSTALWNDPAPAPRPAGWGAATHVAAGLWRIADPRGIVVGHVRAIAADGDWRYAAERFHARVNAWFLDPILKGSYPVAFLDQEAALRAADVRPGDMEAMASTLDFIGINMYSRAIVVHDPSDARSGMRRIQGPGRTTSFGWEIWPPALHRLLRRIDRDYGHPPLLITENGCADGTAPGPDGRVHDESRLDYYRTHIGQVARAIDGGCDVRGYFAWSLLDNFEWAAGYTQRFGITWVDFEGDLRRTVKDSGWWLRDLVAGARLEYDDSVD